MVSWSVKKKHRDDFTFTFSFYYHFLKKDFAPWSYLRLFNMRHGNFTILDSQVSSTKERLL
jgi:hypothetical protein